MQNCKDIIIYSTQYHHNIQRNWRNLCAQETRPKLQYWMPMIIAFCFRWIFNSVPTFGELGLYYIAPAVKKQRCTGLNNYRPDALTAVVMKPIEDICYATQYIRDPFLDLPQFVVHLDFHFIFTSLQDPICGFQLCI